MYEELIKRLAYCRNNAAVISAEELVEIVDAAADAIEELEFACNRYEKDYKALCEYLPKWIPVTERLPEERKAVIVWEPRYLNPYICVLSEGEWYVFGGYGVKVFGVTHWMPQPAPPKEMVTDSNQMKEK